jgi:hypothetical protein
VLHASPAAAHRESPLAGAALSIGFWLCLLIAGGLFAAASLAPRVIHRANLRSEFAARQSELLTLQSEVSRLAEVERALKGNGTLSVRMATRDLASNDRGWSVRVSEPLRFDVRTVPTPVETPRQKEPWHLSLARRLNRSPEMRRWWLLCADGLVAFGFIFLHESAGSRAMRGVALWPVRKLAARYSGTSGEHAAS